MGALNIWWAIVDDSLAEAVDFYPTREEAERTLQKILCDEPAWVDLLRIEPIDFATAPPLRSARTDRRRDSPSVSSRANVITAGNVDCALAAGSGLAITLVSRRFVS